ncbi:unnamed protein product [Porites lobata]|uniref:Uncharacterized protein n=1 Tax=Porites lobata TaxID=104759 RepID=A0ABN8RVY1_9CNID|nr:unnamed protein product [Porites lobata]
MSKANIGGFKGIRDDLEFLLKEDLSSINLCALHCELRNTEELLSSLGLFLYKVGSLDECNAELANYGPENFSSRITVKMKEGQETAVEKHSIQVSSFSGSTEREFLANIETIVRNSLLHDKFKSFFADPESAKDALLNKVTIFCNDRIKYYQDMAISDTFTRDFGSIKSKEETITLTDSEAVKEVQRRLEFWQGRLRKSRKDLWSCQKSVLVGQLTLTGKTFLKLLEVVSSRKISKI